MIADSERLGLVAARRFERRQYRYRRIYWLIVPPILVVVVASALLDNLIAGLLVVLIGLMVTLLVMIRDAVDMLGFLGSTQNDALRQQEAIRFEIADLKQAIARRG
jgi:hypothetical protein